MTDVEEKPVRKSVPRATIQLLPEHIANQISAGEVVERPASIVKELLENCIDAGADQIDIVIQAGGLQSIQITDNGQGIPEQELALAVSRHATSKINCVDDLFSLESMGFRGEALASIASVTKFSLTSRTKDAKHASCWRNTTVDKQSDFAIEPASHPVGTTVQANELFYNTPARRRFIKSERTEFKHIEDVVKQIALGNCAVGISLKHQQRSVLQIPPAKTQADIQLRLVRILGKAYAHQLIELDYSASGLSLSGWLCSPEIDRSQTDLQFFYINNRIVRDKIMLHALKQVLEPYIHPGRQPVCVLFLTIPRDQVDVNVHPTKHEVRFTSPRLVHDFIAQVIKSSLQDVNPQNYVTLPEQTFSSAPDNLETNIHEVSTPYNYAAAMPATTRQWHNSMFGRSLGLIQQRYALFEHAAGLLLVDMNLAYKTYLANELQFIKDDPDRINSSKTLLMPMSFDVSQRQAKKFEAQLALFQLLGLQFVLSSSTQVRLLELPRFLALTDLSALVSKLIKQGFSSESELIAFIKEHASWSMENDEAAIQECLQAVAKYSSPDINRQNNQNTFWHLLPQDALEELFSSKNEEFASHE